MHNIKSNFDKIYQTIKSLDLGMIDSNGNIPKPGKCSQLSDLEVISLYIVAEYMSLDSENWLFKKIKSDYHDQFPFLIDRTRFNRRKRQLFPLLEKVRQQLDVNAIKIRFIYLIFSIFVVQKEPPRSRDF